MGDIGALLEAAGRNTMFVRMLEKVGEGGMQFGGEETVLDMRWELGRRSC